MLSMITNYQNDYNVGLNKNRLTLSQYFDQFLLKIMGRRKNFGQR
jgi:hypothetical protein